MNLSVYEKSKCKDNAIDFYWNGFSLPSSEDDSWARLDAILGEDRLRDDLEAPLPFRDTRLRDVAPWDDPPSLLDPVSGPEKKLKHTLAKHST